MIEFESIQHATARLDPAIREEENETPDVEIQQEEGRTIHQHITTHDSKIRSSKKRGRE